MFWGYVAQAGKLDAAAAGRGLHTIYDSLVDYYGELPRAGRAEEVRAMLEPFAPSDDVELLCPARWPQTGERSQSSGRSGGPRLT